MDIKRIYGPGYIEMYHVTRVNVGVKFSDRVRFIGFCSLDMD